MSGVTIVESGMTFGPFPAADCFQVETSATYRKIQAGVMMAEFLLVRQQDSGKILVLVIEAKSSSPRPHPPERFGEFIGELRDKLVNGLSLGMAAILTRHPASASELPSSFKYIDLRSAEFRLMVVIKGHDKEWLPPLQEALDLALHPTVKTWALGASSVVVINDEMARQRGLVSS